MATHMPENVQFLNKLADLEQLVLWIIYWNTVPITYNEDVTSETKICSL